VALRVYGLKRKLASVTCGACPTIAASSDLCGHILPCGAVTRKLTSGEVARRIHR
jgi:hypothetical protein